MNTAVNLIRKQFSRKMQLESAKGIEFSNSIENENSKPKCRFMQYIRTGDKQRRLAMVSEDGTKMVALSDGTCVASDMIEFIEQRYNMDSLLDYANNTDILNVNNEIRLLSPILKPSKIIGIEYNYRDQCCERNLSTPKQPTFFMKSNSAIIGALDCIRAPKSVRTIDYENELAVIIGKTAKGVSRSDAMGYIFGYTIAQDLTARDWEIRVNGQQQHLISKSIDTFCPLGPTIVHKSHVPDPYNLYIKTYVNGEERQNSNTRHMIFKIDYIIHRLSQFMTLLPGDIILTGTPSGTGAYHKPAGFLKAGDLVESHIQNLGCMKNRGIGIFSNSPEFVRTLENIIISDIQGLGDALKIKF